MSLPGVEPVYSSKQVAAHLGVTESTVRRLVRDKLLRAVRLSDPKGARQHVRIPASAVAEYLESHCTVPKASQRRASAPPKPRPRHFGTRRVGAIREAGWALEFELDSDGDLIVRWRDGLDTDEKRLGDPRSFPRLIRAMTTAWAEETDE